MTILLEKATKIYGVLATKIYGVLTLLMHQAHKVDYNICDPICENPA